MEKNKNSLRRGKTPQEEKHDRIPKEDIDVTQYNQLTGKVLMTLTKKHGRKVFGMRDDLISLSYEILLMAKKVYDPSRGTFVTLAYLRLYTLLDRYIFRELKRQSREFLSLDKTKANHDSGYDPSTTENFKESIEGASFDMDIFFERYLGTDQEKAFRAVVEGWTDMQVIRNTGYSYEDFLPQMQEVLDEMMEWCTILSGGHEKQYKL